MNVYAKAAVLTAAIFFLGLTAAWFLEETRVSAVQAELSSLKTQADEARVSLLFFETFRGDPSYCALFASEMQSAIKRVGALGDSLEKLREENKLDESYYSLKRQYVLFNTELWINAFNYKTSCGGGGAGEASAITTILYFYPEQNCVDCARQAVELLKLKTQCPDSVWLFALPTDLSVSVVDLLKQKYGVTQTPSLVVDGELVAGFHSLDELRARFPQLAKCV